MGFGGGCGGGSVGLEDGCDAVPEGPGPNEGGDCSLASGECPIVELDFRDPEEDIGATVECISCLTVAEGSCNEEKWLVVERPAVVDDEKNEVVETPEKEEDPLCWETLEGPRLPL